MRPSSASKRVAETRARRQMPAARRDDVCWSNGSVRSSKKHWWRASPRRRRLVPTPYDASGRSVHDVRGSIGTATATWPSRSRLRRPRALREAPARCRAAGRDLAGWAAAFRRRTTPRSRRPPSPARRSRRTCRRRPTSRDRTDCASSDNSAPRPDSRPAVVVFRESAPGCHRHAERREVVG